MPQLGKILREHRIASRFKARPTSSFRPRTVEGVTTAPARVVAQLGHANPAITLAVYTHLFEQARHSDELRDALDDGFGHLLDGNGMLNERAKRAANRPGRTRSNEPAPAGRRNSPQLLLAE